MRTKIRMEGLTLTVKNVKRSLTYYTKKLGFKCEVNAAPYFGMVRVGGPKGGTIGLLASRESEKGGAVKRTVLQNRAIHVELSSDDLDSLYIELLKKGVKFHEPPHDEPWERSACALDPDGYLVEFAQGHRGKKNNA
jgi:catechol 2,3-dioxygenase-like lactoylglutathione lyase family enzyme